MGYLIDKDLSKLPTYFATLSESVAAMSGHEEAEITGSIQEILATASFGEVMRVWATDAYSCHAHAANHNGASYQAEKNEIKEKLQNANTFEDFKAVIAGVELDMPDSISPIVVNFLDSFNIVGQHSKLSWATSNSQQSGRSRSRTRR
ncbi:hypothetical protein N9L19_01520 [bacterium]|nr:hypothetical protein [bacterium]